MPAVGEPPIQRGPVGTGTFNAEAFDGAEALRVVLELAEPALISGDFDRAKDATQRILRLLPRGSCRGYLRRR